MKRTWWKESTIYQIYPRSFKDSNGDGIGDIRGIIEKLDYLKELGVDVIWLSPVYQSPNDDNGYDISDYYNIMDEFGTMDDFDELLAGMKARGLKIIMDLVANHTSDEHAWFEESRKSKDNPYRDYYIWKPNGSGTPPNDWFSFFTGSAWELDSETNEYYLHLFTRKQPDLNWENPKVRQEIYDMMHFWMQKGIDGFRMDVIPLISKEQDYPSFPKDYDGPFAYFYATGPRLHEYLKEMHQEVMSQYDMMTVGEGIGVTKEEANDYVGEDRNELNMIFHFDHMHLDRGPEIGFTPHEWTVKEFMQIFVDWDRALDERGWNSLYLGNHDQARIVSRFGSDGPLRVVSAKMLGTLLFTLRGTPYIYQGDEIGMTNTPFNGIEEYRDVHTINTYKEIVAENGNLEQFYKGQDLFSRDHARTPVQWDATPNAGFTTGTPWIKVNPNYPEINVAKALSDPDSIFYYYKRLIQLRKDHPALVYAPIDLVVDGEEHVLIYQRQFEGEVLLITLNFQEKAQEIQLPDSYTQHQWSLLLTNYPKENLVTEDNLVLLQPYEANIFLRK